MLNRILTKLTALHEIHATKKRRSKDRRLMLALSIFPGRCQPSIVDRNELNYRVRNGNGWTLILISTNYMSSSTARKQTILYCPSRLLSRHFLSGDPYRIRTDVNGVRGRCLNHLTNGPYRKSPAIGSVISYGTPSGTRTLDTLIKSQVLYQLS